MTLTVMSARPTSPQPASQSQISAVELPLRAQAALAARDLDGYLQLFDAAERVEDPQRRYWSTRTLVEQGLAASAELPTRELPALYTTLLQGALGALEREPREPRLLNYAAVLLYELWALRGARELFKAAARLDPALVAIERNLLELAQRQRELRGAQRSAPLHPDLPQLERRALAVAERAQPATDLRLSLCMIVRDEQEMLPRCLAAVADVVDEIVLVDTGSSDRTIEIARSFGARVLERAWTGSFADARNAGFDAARGDWLLVLDADEILVREDAPLLRALTGRTWREAFYLAETNYTGELQVGSVVTHNTLRVFRNRPQYRYHGRLHEQIADCLPGYLPERIEDTPIRIDHYGYLGAVRDSREKSRRNIELLRLQQAESPETAFLHYNLGSEYAVAGDAPTALAEFERAWELLQGDPRRESYPFAPALASRLVRALRACERPRDAIARADEALVQFEGFTDLVFEQAHAYISLGDRARAVELYERCIALGDASGRYTATVGCGSYLPAIALAELRLQDDDTPGALELLRGCIREHPTFVGTVLPYATALLASGSPPDAVLAEIEQRAGELAAPARFMLGTALYEAGATSAGEEQFRLVLARQPHAARARVALGEALLAQRRYAEAAEVVTEIPSADPLAAVGARTELFALILSGADAQAGLRRARESGMGRAELDLFGDWIALASERAAEIPLTAAAVPLLGTILDALLRVQELRAFESALGLLALAPLSERERRELLADTYLRRGFAASAAEEWMAVCREQPDVRALLGLARVAERQGMAAEVADFAQAALAIEPENQPAATLLARAQARGATDSCPAAA